MHYIEVLLTCFVPVSVCVCECVSVFFSEDVRLESVLLHAFDLSVCLPASTVMKLNWVIKCNTFQGLTVIEQK